MAKADENRRDPSSWRRQLGAAGPVRWCPGPSLGRLLRALVVVCLGIGGLSVTLAESMRAFATTSVWTVSASYPSLPSNLYGVACPSTTTCFAAGDLESLSGSVLVTTDGGSVWTQQPLPSGVFSLSAITCPSTSDCVAVGSGSDPIVTTTDGGVTWTVRSAPNGVLGLSAIACPSTSDCWAVGSYFNGTTSVAVAIVSTNGGSTWAKQTLPSGRGLPTGISCPSTTECLVSSGNQNGATPGIFVTTHGGTTWSNRGGARRNPVTHRDFLRVHDHL